MPDNVTAVNIKVIGIEYRHEGEWTEVDGFEHKTFNLLELQKGNSLPLGDFELPAGHYTQIRFKLAIPEKEEDVKSNPDCNITFKEAPTVPLFVPSGGQSGYKGIGEFDIIADANVSITADWDVGRSIVVTGSDKYLLKPVIRLVVTELSGWIKGRVVDVGIEKYTGNTLVVYAYKDGNYTDGEVDLFPNAVTSDNVDMIDGNFTLAFLGEGNYSLVTAHYIGTTFDEVVHRKDKVEVFKATETPVELNTSKTP